MIRLSPRPGFDWRRVAWGRPDSPPSALCCYCAAAIPEDHVPLILWNAEGASARFCDICMRRQWGFAAFVANRCEEDIP